MIPDTRLTTEAGWVKQVPAEEELPEGIDVELEKTPSKDPEEAMYRYVEAVEKMQRETERFPPYYVEFTKWTKGKSHGKVKLSTHVQIPRAMLKALIVMRGILREFEEDSDARED